MEPNSVTGRNHSALPGAGQCLCSCFLSLDTLGLRGCHWKLNGYQKYSSVFVSPEKMWSRAEQRDFLC